MTRYEYKVVPAPRRGLKAKGVKGSEAMFAHALASVMNGLGAEGWEYVRADTLPCEERQGLTGKTTVFQNMLVFRRPLAVAAPRTAEVQAPVPQLAAPEPLAPPAPEPASPATPATAAADTPPAAPAVVMTPEALSETLRRPAPPVGPAAGNRHAAE